MQKISRRQLAIYAVDQLAANAPISGLAKQLGAILVATKRSNQITQLMEDVAYEFESRGIMAQVTVTTAFPLTEQLKTELNRFIKTEAKVGSVNIDEITDTTVLGGLRIDTATRSWDQTLKRRLTDIREAF